MTENLEMAALLFQQTFNVTFTFPVQSVFNKNFYLNLIYFTSHLYNIQTAGERDIPATSTESFSHKTTHNINIFT